MSSEFEDSLLSKLNDNVVACDDICHQEKLDNRFRLAFIYKSLCGGGDVSVEVIGREARVIASVMVDELDRKVKERILTFFSFDEIDSSDRFSLSLWSRSKHLKKFPPIDRFILMKGLKLECAGPPKQIDHADLACLAITDVLGFLIHWFEECVFELEEFGDTKAEIMEGSEVEVTLTKYERSPINRRICLKHHGYDCSVCDLNLESIYGEKASGFIHVHHLDMLADAGPKVIDPIKDLIPVCPNCHSIIHRSRRAASPQEVRDLIEENREKY